MSESDDRYETEGDVLNELTLEVLQESEESANAYLVQSWLSAAMEKLWDARRHAGLTQNDVAQRLGTKQPAIARLEKDDEGRVSLRRYVEYALACGLLPLDITLEPADKLREYALDNPDAPMTQKAFEAWGKKTVNSVNVPSPSRYTFFDMGAIHHANAWPVSHQSQPCEDKSTQDAAVATKQLLEQAMEELEDLVATVQRTSRTTVNKKPADDAKVSQNPPSLGFAA